MEVNNILKCRYNNSFKYFHTKNKLITALVGLMYLVKWIKVLLVKEYNDVMNVILMEATVEGIIILFNYMQLNINYQDIYECNLECSRLLI